MECNSTGSQLQLQASQWQIGCGEGGTTGGGRVEGTRGVGQGSTEEAVEAVL